MGAPSSLSSPRALLSALDARGGGGWVGGQLDVAAMRREVICASVGPSQWTRHTGTCAARAAASRAGSCVWSQSWAAARASGRDGAGGRRGRREGRSARGALKGRRGGVLRLHCGLGRQGVGTSGASGMPY
eukprot:3798091-Prymnesium_polylepis.2